MVHVGDHRITTTGGAVGQRFGCRVTLLVLPLNHETARACELTFFTGHPGFELTPVSADMYNIPHPGKPGGEDVAVQVSMLSFLNGKFDLADTSTRRDFFRILGQAGERLRTEYTFVACELADSDLRKILEEELTTIYEESFFSKAINQGIAQGRTEGLTQGGRLLLLHILEKRGLKVADSHRCEVNSCTSRKQLETWTDLALTATTIEDVFGH
jgi:hypothetical protein